MSQPAVSAEKPLFKKHLQPVDYYLLAIAGLFLLAMHYFQHNMGGEGLDLPFNSASWIAVSLIVSLGFWHCLKTQAIYFSNADLSILILLVFLILPALWSYSPWVEAAYDRYLALIALVMIIFTHHQFSFSEAHHKTLWMIIVAGIIIQCFFGIFQLAFSSELFHIKNLRPLGVFQQANVFASFIATGFAISLYQILLFKLDRAQKVLYWAMIILAGFFEGMIQSRTGIIGCIIVFLGLSFLVSGNQKNKVAVLIVFFLGVIFSVALKNAQNSTVREGVSNIGYRGTIYNVSIDLIKELPLWGHGIGKFSPVYMNKQAEYFSKNPNLIPKNAELMTHPHNELLFWWVEGGLIPILSIIVFALWLTFRVFRYGGINEKAIWFCSLPLVLHTQTEYPFYHSTPHLILFGLLIANMDLGKARVFKAPFKILPAALMLLTPILVCVFMLSNLHTIKLLPQIHRDKNENLITSVMNPLGQLPRLNYYIARRLFKSSDVDSWKYAEALMIKEILLRPSSQSFWLLHNIQLRLDQQEKAEHTRKKASFLYPGLTIFRDDAQFN
jgi:O-antigen polymerase